MEFGKLENLIYLIAVAILIVGIIFGFIRRRKVIKQLQFLKTGKSSIVRLIIIITGISLIFVSLLDPQKLNGFTKVERKTLDIYVAIDVSKSMNADDIKPSRLIRVKESITNLIESLKGDRIGFIPFASDAYIQMPLTDDYNVSKLFLEAIDTNMMPGGGTNIASALRLAKKSLEATGSGNGVVIVFSDGEEYDKDSLSEAKNMGNIKVYTVGTGTEGGSLVPQFDETGKNIGYVTDESGKYVNSKIDTEILKNIASSASGRFFISTVEGKEIKSLSDSILLLKRDKKKDDTVKDYTKLYQYFLGPGILLLLLGYFMRRSSKLKKKEENR